MSEHTADVFVGVRASFPPETGLCKLSSIAPYIHSHVHTLTNTRTHTGSHSPVVLSAWFPPTGQVAPSRVVSKVSKEPTSQQ